MDAVVRLRLHTGPSIFRRKADLKASAAHGQFFSSWQKQKNGDRKVLIDHGISHGPSGTPDALPTAPLTALDLATQKPDGTVHDAEQDFINRTNKAKSKIAYDFSVTGRTILLRDSPFPISGKAAAIAHPNSNEGTWSWTPKFQGVSVANDFASRLYLRDKRSMMSPRRLDSQIAIWRGVSDEKLWKTGPTLELLNVGGADCTKDEEIRHAKT